MKPGIALAKRVKRSELEAIAARVVLPDRVSDVCAVTGGTEGERLPNGSFSGRGGTTTFGVAWAVEGGTRKILIAEFESQDDARELLGIIAGPEGELWQRREARRARIAQLEAEEAAAEAEAKKAAKEGARLARGDGSSPRERSSEKRSGTIRMRVEDALISRQRLSERTSSLLSSSSRARSRGSSAGSLGPATSPSSGAPS